MARVLVIDDEEPVRMFLGETLVAAGHEVRYAPNGDVGLAAYEAEPFDVVLVDLVMPVKNGILTIKELCERYRDARAIAMAGEDAENLQLALEYGAVSSLSKPVDPTELLEAITTALGKSRGWEGVTE